MKDQSSVQKLTDQDFKSSIGKGKTLVDFHAEWCGPCRMLAPILEEVAQDKEANVAIAKVDIDAEQQTAAEFQVASVPTLILFKEGKELKRLVGLRNKKEILEFIKSEG